MDDRLISSTAVGAAPADTVAADALAEVAPGKPLRKTLREIFSGYTLVGAILVAVVLILAIGAPLFAMNDPQHQDVKNRLAAPFFMAGGSWDHPLGTDGLGRDLWARIIYGFRTSLMVAVPAVILAAGLGVAIGTLAGYFGRFTDTVLMRLTDIQMAFPFIILAIAILSVTRPGPIVLIVVLSLSAWPIYARMVRSIAMVDSQSEYVLAARAMGASHPRIIVRYLMRNLLLSVAVLSTLDIATMIVLEALLSFLGLGIQPPTPSLGSVMADGREYLSLGVWWITTLPGFAILITLFGLNLMGDGLQSKLDPRLRRL
jgi:ABC-type dipeptide/oligopeptide/nickel transport system permease subunit